MRYRAAIADRCKCGLTLDEAKKLLQDFAAKSDCDDFIIADLRRAYKILTAEFTKRRPKEIHHHYHSKKSVVKEVSGYDEKGRIISMTEREVDDVA